MLLSMSDFILYIVVITVVFIIGADSGWFYWSCVLVFSIFIFLLNFFYIHSGRR